MDMDADDTIERKKAKIHCSYSRRQSQPSDTEVINEAAAKMSEGPPPRIKRNGARTFKNPPQPHMCIKDYVRGSQIPCYINVLSWEKVDMPASSNQPLPLYGGMKLTPPRTEDKSTCVFAVIANPEVLRQRGKNSQDLNDQSNLVNVLLDFVESMNKGIVFSRSYTILKDRDITGELKEVWIAVQNQREKESLSNQQETWIDGQPSVPQYSQNTEQQNQQQQQQQQQQKQQQLQQQIQSQQSPQQIPPQINQQVSQQVQQMMQNSYMMSQPPQYQPSIVYNPVPNNECSNYDRYNYQQQNPIPANQNEQGYQSGPMIAKCYNNVNNSFRGDLDRYNYRERGRSLPQQPIPPQQPSPPQQQPPQQNSPAYTASQYHFQQLPRKMVPHFINSNMNPNFTGQMNPVVTSHYTDYMMMQHQHMNTGIDQRQVENQIHAEVHRMQQQQQQQQHQQQQQEQIHGPPPPLMQQPTPQYQPAPMNVMSYPPITGSKRNYYNNKQERVAPPKNNGGKRRNNSPTHVKQGISSTSTNVPQSKDAAAENPAKPKSPVKVLQRDPGLQNKQNVSHSSPEKNSKDSEKNLEENNEACNTQVPDVNEETKAVEVPELPPEVVVPKKPEALSYAAALKDQKDPDHIREIKSTTVESPAPSYFDTYVQKLKDVKPQSQQQQQQQQQSHQPQQSYNQKQRSIKTVLKRNKSCANDVKGWVKDEHTKGVKNGMKTSLDDMNLSYAEWSQDKNIAATEASTGWNAHMKLKPSDSPKRSQSTVNSIIKSVFKIHQGNNTTGDEVGTGKKQKANGHVKTNTKGVTNENEESNQGYTILKKSEVTTTLSSSDEVVVNEIAQLSIQDCKDTTEMNAVLS